MKSVCPHASDHVHEGNLNQHSFALPAALATGSNLQEGVIQLFYQTAWDLL
jgi:hypothetical protein